MKTIEEVKEEHLDLTGLMCPLPVVITSEKMRKLQEGQILTVISTDPGFERDIMSWCGGYFEGLWIHRGGDLPDCAHSL